ncbi:MAG: Crp/Fnr family transcriptional regulator [Cyanosarcina radialis HA8281-LM2]|jgi:CRP-like cAMP-binding protein|nr:Crp/Fnr family transcriptional regulator [Cyanosarcina radialis HA8281-LM2]
MSEPRISPPTKNQLLAALPNEEYERLLPNLEPVSLELKKRLYTSDKPIEYVYFVETGVVSLLALLETGKPIEIATVGNEGMVGLSVFLEVDRVPGEAFVQIPGLALRMQAEIFKQKVVPGSVLYRLLQRYTQGMFNTIAQTAVCNRVHSIEERFCRWILMTHDRVEGDEFPLTHEFLSQMLGVRRASVSEAAAALQRAELIRYKQGKMTILDRAGLEETACECYTIIRREYERLLGQSKG